MKNVYSKDKITDITTLNERRINMIRWDKDKLEMFDLSKEKRKVVLPEDIDKVIETEYKEIPQNIGRDTFYGIISRKYIGISRRRLYDYLKNQPLYQRGRDRITQPMAKPVISNKPFERVQIDLIDTKKLSNLKFPFTLTYIDTFSKKVYARALANKEESTVQAGLKDILKSLPEGARIRQIQSDNGSEFNNIQSVFTKSKSIKSSPYNPASNGMIERVHRFIKKYIYFANITKVEGFRKQLQKVLDLYNERKNTITKYTPNELDKVDLSGEILKKVKERIQQSGGKNSLVERNFPPLEKGDFVRLAIIRKSPLEKLYEQWSSETYEVTQIRQTKPPTYKLKNKSFIYQRDYLLKIPKASEILRQREQIELTTKEKAEKQKKTNEQEAVRQTAQRNRQLAKVTQQKKYLYTVGQKLLFSKKWFETHDTELVNLIDDKTKKKHGARNRVGEISSKSNNKYWVKFIDADFKDYTEKQTNVYDKDAVEKDAQKI